MLPRGNPSADIKSFHLYYFCQSGLSHERNLVIAVEVQIDVDLKCLIRGGGFSEDCGLKISQTRQILRVTHCKILSNRVFINNRDGFPHCETNEIFYEKLLQSSIDLSSRTSLIVVFVTCSAIAMIIVEFYYEFTIH